MRCRIAVAGLYGRMGCAIARLAEQDHEFILTGGIVREPAHRAGQESLMVVITAKEIMESADVLLDFTTPQATLQHLLDFQDMAPRKAAVVGTTGFDEADLAQLQVLALKIPIVLDSNFSMGIALIRQALGFLGQDFSSVFDGAIVETHRREKKDAPSGTARDLAKSLIRLTGKDVPISSLRLGEAMGEHRLYLSTAYDVVEIVHRAYSREAYAQGALAAAKWIVHQKPGLYRFSDVFKNSPQNF